MDSYETIRALIPDGFSDVLFYRAYYISKSREGKALDKKGVKSVAGKERDCPKSIRFVLSEKEYRLIRDRMDAMRIRNMSAYLRKMAIDGYCVHLDLDGLREMTTLLKRCSNNLNQYAKKANQSGSIYKEDIEDLRKLMEKIYQAEKRILDDLAHLK